MTGPDADYIVVETGERHAAEADYEGHRIQVATGYSAIGDNYPIHVYLQKIGPDGRLGVREKLQLSGHADSKREAFVAGMQAARREIDQL